MNTNHKSPQHLLQRMLAEQAAHITEDRVYISEQRMQEVLNSGKSFSPAEQCLFLQSPITRERFVFLSQVAKAKFYQQQRDEPKVIERMAADTKEAVERQEIHTESHSLYLVPYQNGASWEIAVRIHDKQLRQAPTGLKLVDDSGRVWVSGKPDKEGEINGYWEETESPLQVLKRQTLHLELL